MDRQYGPLSPPSPVLGPDVAAGVLALATLVYGLALWLGLYLLGREPATTRPRLAGLGLMTYALAVALDILVAAAPAPALAAALARARWPFLLLPALCWTGTIVGLLPEGEPTRTRLARLWRSVLTPATVLLATLGAVAGPPPGGGAWGWWAAALAVVVLAPLLLTVGLLWRARWAGGPRNAIGVLLAATLFFALGTGLLLLRLAPLPPPWLGLSLLAIGVDLIALGVAVAALDAFAQGEALLPDFVRSFDVCCLAATLFGGQVALAMALGPGVTFPLLALLLTTIATAIAAQVFADRLAAALDRLAFARFPRLRKARGELRAAASALPREDPALDLDALDEAEFARLTRRALGHFGDLPRLAASPLTSLPAIDRRLAGRGARDDALERAGELKALLAESVARLKPRARGDFGTSGEWRHYNALYFPYVAGLKPYSRRAEHNGLDPAARAALDWFRTSVPERTLYNWQAAAAKLVAQDLRARAGSRENERGLPGG